MLLKNTTTCIIEVMTHPPPHEKKSFMFFPKKIGRGWKKNIINRNTNNLNKDAYFFG